MSWAQFGAFGFFLLGVVVGILTNLISGDLQEVAPRWSDSVLVRAAGYWAGEPDGRTARLNRLRTELESRPRFLRLCSALGILAVSYLGQLRLLRAAFGRTGWLPELASDAKMLRAAGMMVAAGAGILGILLLPAARLLYVTAPLGYREALLMTTSATVAVLGVCTLLVGVPSRREPPVVEIYVAARSRGDGADLGDEAVWRGCACGGCGAPAFTLTGGSWETINVKDPRGELVRPYVLRRRTAM